MKSKEMVQAVESAAKAAQTQDEEQCIEIFLNWYNKRFKTDLSYHRAEKVFPEIY